MSLAGHGGSDGRQTLDPAGAGPGRVAAEGRHAAGLSEAIGYDFKNPDLLDEALTHSSAAAGGLYRFGNERLEFLGDRVLGLVVSEMLYAEYPEEAEGSLARRFTGLVRREALERVADKIGLGRYVVMADSEERAGGRRNRSMQADACEALIGALYLDGGIGAARRFILAYWRPLIAAHGRGRRDAKTRLQEWAQARRLALPYYRVLSREGPPHAPVFTVETGVGGFEPATGTAPSKRAAEQAAATALLEKIDAEDSGEP